MKLKCLIVDDEQLARKLIDTYCKKLDYLQVVKECKNSLEAISVLQSQPVDLIFLDIQMPELTGLEMLKTLKKRPEVILTTAYPEYALEGYEHDVVDYLLKPFSFERFLQAVNKASATIKLKSVKPTINKAGDIAPKFITVKADHKLHKIPLNDIRYIEGLREYVSFYVGEKRIVSLESLKNLESTLPPGNFIRVHKSYIVNVKKVKSLEGNMLILQEKKIPVGKSYRKKVMRMIFDN